MKILTIIQQAGDLCGDPDLSKKGAPWWVDKVNTFFAATSSDHAETRLNMQGTLDPVPAGLTSDSDFPWDDCYDCACRYFLCWYYYGADSEDTRDQVQADRYRKLYDAEFLPAG